VAIADSILANHELGLMQLNLSSSSKSQDFVPENFGRHYNAAAVLKPQAAHTVVEKSGGLLEDIVLIHEGCSFV
jgi:hypothetical protein